jgi:hypothetical protein
VTVESAWAARLSASRLIVSDPPSWRPSGPGAHHYLARNPQFFAADFTFPRRCGAPAAGRSLSIHAARVYAVSGPFRIIADERAHRAHLPDRPRRGGAFIGISFATVAFALTRVITGPVTFLSALLDPHADHRPVVPLFAFYSGLGWIGRAEPGLVAFLCAPAIDGGPRRGARRDCVLSCRDTTGGCSISASAR